MIGGAEEGEAGCFKGGLSHRNHNIEEAAVCEKLHSG